MPLSLISLLHCGPQLYASPGPGCSAHCSCGPRLDPVCGSDGLMYPSPCLAGCQHSTGQQSSRAGTLGIIFYLCHSIAGRSNFTDCSCIDDQISTAVATPCDKQCSYLNIFLPFLFIRCQLSFH